MPKSNALAAGDEKELDFEHRSTSQWTQSNTWNRRFTRSVLNVASVFKALGAASDRATDRVGFIVFSSARNRSCNLSKLWLQRFFFFLLFRNGSSMYLKEKRRFRRLIALQNAKNRGRGSYRGTGQPDDGFIEFLWLYFLFLA